MESIKKLVTDPGWWITAVVVGLIISTAAGFLKDYLSRILSTSSSRFALWRKQRDAVFDAEVEEFSHDSGLIAYLRITAVGQLVLWSNLFLIMVSAYIFLKIAPDMKRTAMGVMISSGLLSFVPYLGCIRTLRLSYHARLKYSGRKKNKEAEQGGDGDAEEAV